jgi:hypothetical protein
MDQTLTLLFGTKDGPGWGMLAGVVVYVLRLHFQLGRLMAVAAFAKACPVKGCPLRQSLTKIDTNNNSLT